jgi:hypothetical protein
MTRLGRFSVAALVACGIAAAPAGAAAKGQKKTRTHEMTGCLQKGDEANTFKLTNVEGKGPKTVEIVETASGINLAPHVGHKVAITGTTVGAREAAKAEGTAGTKGAKKEERGEYHMKADAVKMISTTCS